MKAFGVTVFSALGRKGGQRPTQSLFGKFLSDSNTYSTTAPHAQREAESHAELVTTLSERLINEPAVAQAMITFDRQFFARAHSGIPLSVCYKDYDVPIGYGQHVTSPSVHAVCLDTLFPYIRASPGAAVLDVGAGTGYLSACFSYLVGEQGRVVAIEVLDELLYKARWALAQTILAPRSVSHPSQATVSEAAPDFNTIFNVTLFHSNALEVVDELAQLGPFTAINVGASTAAVPPELLQLLAPGGALLIPIGRPNQEQDLTLFERQANGEFSSRKICRVSLAPLAPGFVGSRWRM